MKLAYRACIVTLILFTFVFAVSAQTASTTTTDARSVKDPRNTAPTVGTGGPVGGPTGLFTVYDGDTLRKGEFTFSVAYSNYDRDPGNADIVSVPLSFQYGITNRLEFFFETEAMRNVKINSPRNLSSFALPNSRILINGTPTSPGAIILAPSGPGTGAFENAAIYRPIGTQPFIQYPYVGGSAGNFGLNFPFTPGPLFGFPAGSAFMGPPVAAGNGADRFPGIGSVYGSILPGIVLSTVCTPFPGSPTPPATCLPAATTPTVFTLAPSYLNDAPFINRTYGETAFNHLTGGIKWRWTGINNPIGVGLIASYRWYMDNADDFAGFNQLQRGASPGGNRGDINVTLFGGARLAKWANLSANVGYTYTSAVKGDLPGGTFTLLDRGDEAHFAIGADFPINKFFQPILEIRNLRYIGGRTPNAFENNPTDALAGFRIFPARWFGFGLAYRYHANEQNEDSFNDEDNFDSTVLITCPPQTTGCVPRTITTQWSGMPPGFQASENPHGYIVQFFAGRRKKRQAEIINQFANVESVTLSDTTITLGCPPGFRPREGTVCNDSTSVSVATIARDPENDVLTYNYTVSGGRIVGTGANVSWDVSGLQPGTYTITAGVDDGCGLCGKTQTQTITIAECVCDRICECPSLSVTGPAGITQPGDSMTFTANVSGGTAQNVTYNWTTTSGTITSGQGTPSITVATNRDMAGSNVEATVTITLDVDCNCPKTASASGPIEAKPTPILVDEFGKLSNDEIRSRLDAFFADLSNNPTHQGYIINYGTDREIAARERLITSHIAFRNFDRNRITLVRGGASTDGEPRTKLYRIPPGADNPNP
ncbi:MAG TPA: hypothetical protein VNA22_05740 [Pyrinomonadaceae bacterium]|nr:hypothetical protein [Pyrinomonadaceae bacterium]